MEPNKNHNCSPFGLSPQSRHIGIIIINDIIINIINIIITLLTTLLIDEVNQNTTPTLLCQHCTHSNSMS